VTGAAETLLTPWLATTSTDLASGLRAGVAPTGGGQLGRHHLMENVQIGLDPEHLGIEGDVSTGGAVDAV
jgi:hypothetical protein